MRPELTKDITIQEFRDYYWLKEELQHFCREHAISASGSKMEIADRIEVFLITGEIKKPIRKTTKVKQQAPQAALSLETIIMDNHRCSQEVRAFFKSVIPKFHFSTYIQDYLKNNIGKTYQDVVDAWYEEEVRKKSPSYQKNVAPQFEYNRFIRDFFADPKNCKKSRQDATKAWHDIKKLPGSNAYRSVN